MINTNFNTDLSIWQNYRAANKDTFLSINDGNIWSPRDGTLARFTNNNEAIKLLKSAGFKDNEITILNTEYKVIYVECSNCKSQNKHECRADESQKGKAITCQHCGTEIKIK